MIPHIVYRDQFHVDLINMCRKKCINLPTSLGTRSPYFRVPACLIKNIFSFIDIESVICSFYGFLRPELRPSYHGPTTEKEVLDQLFQWYNLTSGDPAKSLVIVKYSPKPLVFCNPRRSVQGPVYKSFRIRHIWTSLTIRQINNRLIKLAHPKMDYFKPEKPILSRFELLDTE